MLQARLEKYEPPDLLLNRDDVINKLVRDRTLYEEHCTRQNRLKNEIKQSQQQQQIVRQDLGLSLTDTITLPSEAIQQEITRQIETYNQDQHDLNTAKAQCAIAAEKIEQAQQALTVLPEPKKGESLRRLVEVCTQLGDIEAQIDRIRQQQKSAAMSIEQQKNKLSLQGLSIEEISQLNIPSNQVINTYLEQFNESDHKLEQTRSEQEQFTTQLSDVEEQLRRESLEVGLITEQDLTQTREARNQIWSTVKLDWFESKTTANDLQRQEAEQLDQLLLKTDEQSDRLRREANRAAQHAQLTANKEALQQKLLAQREKLAHAQAQQQALENCWQDEWSKAVNLLEPKAMLGWAEQCLALQNELAQQKINQSEQQKLQDRCQQHITLLQKELNKSETGQPFNLLLSEAKQRLQQLQANNEQHQRQQTLLENSQADLKRHQSGLVQAEQRRAEWKTHWQVLMEALMLPADATPDMASTQLDLYKQWSQHQQAEDKLRLELEEVEQGIEQFTCLAFL